MAVEAFLPLFPLDLVLLPGELLPLHIFEPRYRSMISQKHSDGGEFGIVRQHAGGIERTGCAATVHSITERFDDGRFNVLVMGTRRFVARMIDSSEECWQAVAEFFDDDEHGAASAERERKLIEIAQAVLGAGEDTATEGDARRHSVFSFRVAAGLPLGPETKQSLLEARSEIERVDLLIKHLEGVVESRRESRKRMLAARGNGRLRH